MREEASANTHGVRDRPRRCCHRTNEDVLTLEHLPPKSAGNDHPINFVGRGRHHHPRGGGGHAIPALTLAEGLTTAITTPTLIPW